MARQYWQSLNRIVAPKARPVTLSSIKAQIRGLDCSDTSEDALLLDYLDSIISYCEEYQGRAYAPSTWQMTLDAFPCSPFGQINLPRSPVVAGSVVIEYVDTEGNEQTLATSEYQVDRYSEPGRIRPAYAKSWPATRPDMNSVIITWQAGILDYTPAAAKQAIRLMVVDAYENRSSQVETALSANVAAKNLLDQGRLVWL